MSDEQLLELCEILRQREINAGDWPPGGMPEAFRRWMDGETWGKDNPHAFSVGEAFVRRLATNRLAEVLAERLNG